VDPIRFETLLEQQFLVSFENRHGESYLLETIIELQFDIVADVYDNSVTVGFIELYVFDLDKSKQGSEIRHFPKMIRQALASAHLCFGEEGAQAFKSWNDLDLTHTHTFIDLQQAGMPVAGVIAYLAKWEIVEEYRGLGIGTEALREALNRLEQDYEVDFTIVYPYPYEEVPESGPFERKTRALKKRYNTLGFVETIGGVKESCMVKFHKKN
jgi:ribosomal protein S18 acetylase RimI-like enzyme